MWNRIYTKLADMLIGKTVSRKELLAMARTLFPNEYKDGSQGPTDYRGVRNPVTGKVERAASQSSQYRPLLFEGTGDSFTGLSLADRVGKPSTRGTSGLSDAELVKALISRGILPTPAPTVPTAPVVPAPSVAASKTNGEAKTAPASK
jgi:hypothetical protein